MHFTHLWELGRGTDQAEFWEVTLAVSGAVAIPEIGKLIAPSSAAFRVERVEEFSPLLDRLASPPSDDQPAAANAFKHLIGSRLGTNKVDGFDADLWAEVLASSAGAWTTQAPTRSGVC